MVLVDALVNGLLFMIGWKHWECMIWIGISKPKAIW